MRKTILGGIAVTATLGAMLASGATAGPTAGKPTDSSFTICGTGTAPTSAADGQSNESKFGGGAFTGNEAAYAPGSCNSDNSSSGNSSWNIVHGNVNTVTERGTEHGQYLLEGSTTAGGFNGHVTDWDFNGDACQDGQGRTVYYQSGDLTDCTPSFGPVGNFNTHGGAATGQHFRGKYGTIIYQQDSSNPTSHNCDVGSSQYCIEIDLSGQTN